MNINNKIPSFFNQNEIKKITSMAFDAGEIATKSFKSHDFTVARKADNSEVTSADIKISEFLNKNLSAEFPNIPVICEELGLKKVDNNIFWLIDPIDGTSSFIKGVDQFSINISLIKDHKAIFGLIYAPIFENSKMAYLNHESKIVMIKNQQEYFLEPDNVKQETGSKKLKIVTSKRTTNQDIIIYLNQDYQDIGENYQIEKLSSAIKFFRILENDCQLYLHLNKTMEWDTAAGQALVEAANGKVKNFFFSKIHSVIGTDLTYQKPNFANQPFIAYNQLNFKNTNHDY
jgi:3'(2'), 5'-bisphosphate nucleotidase